MKDQSPFPRDQVLDLAVTLFREFGFGTVSMSDIIAKTMVSKEQMDEHFPSKEQLILTALERFDRQSREFFATAVAGVSGGLRTKLVSFFNTLGDLFDDPEFYGCLFINAAVEYPQLSEPVHRLALSHKDLFRRMMYDLSIQHGLEHAEAHRLSEELLLVFDGVCVAYQRTREAKEIQSAKRLAEAILDRHGVLAIEPPPVTRSMVAG